jgi:hypothetical protein
MLVDAISQKTPPVTWNALQSWPKSRMTWTACTIICKRLRFSAWVTATAGVDNSRGTSKRKARELV